MPASPEVTNVTRQQVEPAQRVGNQRATSLFSSVNMKYSKQRAPAGFSEPGAQRGALLVQEGQLWLLAAAAKGAFAHRQLWLSRNGHCAPEEPRESNY